MEGSLIAGRYRVDSRIGEGGVATVYKGLDITLEREVAIKVLRPEMAQNPEALMRFRREAHSAAKLNHPNIVQIYDTGTEDETHYIVMEYLPEPDLKRIIREYAPLPLRKVLEVSIQCARALVYAHRQGIIHRDVKPHNILFTDDGRVKLSDFGIAAAAGETGLTAQGQVLGTAYYISPEQAQGGAATAQSDVYSLGVVMFECITGQPPFTGGSPAEIAAKHVRERPPALRSLNSGITPSAEFVINKAMSREAVRRYRSAEELLVDLEKLADGIELDRTGVLGLASDEATMRLTPAPGSAPLTPLPARPAPPTPPATAPAAPVSPREPEKAAGSVAATTAVAVLIAVVALLGVGWLVKQAFYPGQPPRKVSVPSVKGLSLAEARREITAAGLQVGDVSYREDDRAPNGTVIEQLPGIDQPVEENTTVALVLSRGKETVTVPQVSGRTVAEARERLENANLHVGEVQEIYHEKVPKGLIVKQGIAPGTQVEAGAGVDLTVSKGVEEKELPPVEELDKPETVADAPVVEVRQDESYHNENAAERRFIIKISAMGLKRGQLIQIVKSDDSGRGIVVVSTTLGPGETMERKIKVLGNATLEVYHNEKSVFAEDYSLNVSP